MVGLTKHIRYYIIRKAVGIGSGTNEVEIVDPNKFDTLGKLIGRAGVNLQEYAAFFGFDFDREYIDRTIQIKNLQDIYFVHRDLLDIPPKHIVRDFSIP